MPGSPVPARRPLRTATGLVLAVAFALSACSSPSDRRPAQSFDDGVRALFDRRASQLVTGDVGGYLEVVAPAARPVEEAVARGAAAVPLATVRILFNVLEQHGGTTSHRGVAATYVFTYRGVPEDNRFSFRLLVDLEEKPQGWVVTSAQPLGDLPYWATGPVEVTTSPHFLVLSRPGVAGVGDVVAVAEESRAQLLSRLTVEPDAVHVMIVVAEGTELARLQGSEPQPGASLVAFSEYSTTGAGPPESRQMAVDVRAVAPGETAVSEDRREVTAVQLLQHELAHLALARYATPTRPDWVVEGAAMFLAEERREANWRDPAFQARAVSLSFTELNSLEDLPADLYAYVNATVLFLVERFGAQAFWDFYRAFTEADTSASPAATARSLVAQHFGLDEAALGAATVAWIRGALGSG